MEATYPVCGQEAHHRVGGKEEGHERKRKIDKEDKENRNNKRDKFAKFRYTKKRKQKRETDRMGEEGTSATSPVCGQETEERPIHHKVVV